MAEKNIGKKAHEFNTEARRLVMEFVPILTAIDDEDVINEAVTTWIETFKLTPFAEDEGNSDEVNFGLFLRSLVPVSGIGNVRVRAGLSRDYGKNAITFEIEDYAPRTKAGIQAGFDRCLQTVKIEHDRYVAEFVGKHTDPETDVKNTKPATDVEVMECTKLSVRSESGKLQVRAHGGRFSKWGVPVYDEVLEKAEIEAENIPVKGMEVEGEMHVELQGGKPRRVKQLDLV